MAYVGRKSGRAALISADIPSNLNLLGDYVKIPSATTTERDALTPAVGMMLYNSTLGMLQQYNASGWTSIAAPPVYTSVNITNLEESDTTQTLVITGSNFDTTASAKLLDNNGVAKTPTTSTRNSSTQITITYTSGDLLAETVPQPLDVVVTNGSGLTATGENVLTIDARPVWTTSAGALTDQTYFEDVAIATFNFVATDPEGQTPTYTISSGAIPSGLALSSAGALTGTPNVSDTYNSSGVTHNFDVRANDTTGNTTDRSFSIVRYWADGVSAVRAATSASALKTITSTTTNGYYWIQASGMASAKQLWCDMGTDGGGYMRFWWFNTLEQVGAGSGLGQSWVTDTKFGIADISTITHTQNYGYGRIPSGVTPTKLMVKGTSNQQTSTSPPSYAIWTFNSSNTTSAVMLASMQSGTASAMTPRNNFHPSSTSLDANASTFAGATMNDHWGYATDVFGGTESTFDLNDDTGRDNTTFAAGYDGSASGTDYFQTGSSGGTGNVDNATGRYLAMYWK